MRKLNVNEFYQLGKGSHELSRLISGVKGDSTVGEFRFQLFVTRGQFLEILKEPCALISSSARAAAKVVEAISAVIPEDLDEFFNIDFKKVVPGWRLSIIGTAITNFETILNNDMPEMSAFAVNQIGIFRTEDLIQGAYRQIAATLQSALTDKARADITEAGKCLAFRLSTAAAFHVCRAIEAELDHYFEALTTKPYVVSANGGNNNWGAKIKSLQDAGADEKITEFLLHIKKQYRNPVTHPEVVVGEDESVDLFNASLSAISMMLNATRILVERNTTPMLTGLGVEHSTA